MHIRDIKFDEDGQARVTLCKMLDWLEEWFVFSGDGISRFDLPTKDIEKLKEIAHWNGLKRAGK